MSPRWSRREGERGTTIVEVLISVVILAIAVVTISDAYYSGLQALDARVTEEQLDAHLRSRVERLLAERFAVLASGTENVIAGGESHTLSWTVTPVDLDGDTVAEPSAKHISVQARDRTFDVVVVDHGGWVAKL